MLLVRLQKALNESASLILTDLPSVEIRVTKVVVFTQSFGTWLRVNKVCGVFFFFRGGCHGGGGWGGGCL